MCASKAISVKLTSEEVYKEDKDAVFEGARKNMKYGIIIMPGIFTARWSKSPPSFR